MATAAQITDYSNRIFNAARKGTPSNPGGLPVPLAAFLVAQSRHETGNYTSRFFTDYYNAFGYSYHSSSNWQAGQGPIADNGSAVAAYSSLENSVGEVIDWIYRRVKEGKFPRDLSTIVSVEQYADLLKKAGYYGDTEANYAAGLRRWLSDFGTVVPGAALLLVFTLVIWLITQQQHK